MDRDLVLRIRQRMAAKPIEELHEIWRANDRNRYSDEAFEAVCQILGERGGPLPEQSDGTG